MAPKKNPAFVVQPGIARQHLTEYYPDFPQSIDNLKFGHVIKCYLDNGKSPAQTIKVLCSLYSNVIIKNHALKPLIKEFTHFKHLTIENERKSFCKFCERLFVSFCITDPMDPPLPATLPFIGPSATLPIIDPVPGTSATLPIIDPVPGTSATLPSTCSREKLTPRKLKLKRRLSFLATRTSEERVRHRSIVKKLRSQLKATEYTKIKYLTQDIKRKKVSMQKKDVTISLLRGELRQLRKKQQLPLKASSGATLEEHLKLKEAHRKMRFSMSKMRNVAKLNTQERTKFLAVQENLRALKDELKKAQSSLRDDRAFFENRIVELEEELAGNRQIDAKAMDGKTYNPTMRMIVYNCLNCNIPIAKVHEQIKNRATVDKSSFSSVPSTSTVEQMARELGVIADLKSARMGMQIRNLTLGFDSTTQGGVHINSVHFTSETQSDVFAVDELPGGTAADYHCHITSAIDKLAEVYADFHKENYPSCRAKIIGNISNTMTDRAAVNHATVRKINESWGKSLNELNCHLHPLDTIASTCRSTLKSLETSKGDTFGKDCLVGNIVLAINKIRYKDGKGDPKGFKSLLDGANLPRGTIPRYRGNRLHILFHICGKLIEHHKLFLNFFEHGSLPCGGLAASLAKDFANETAIVEMRVLGLLGKLLTGPWMKKFYTSAESTISHIEGIHIVKALIPRLNSTAAEPMTILEKAEDFFGEPLSVTDTLQLQLQPDDRQLFVEMLSSCLLAIVGVLERQYSRYFNIDISERLEEECKSARCHNIDAEEVMGMYSAGKERAKNAKTDFIVARLRARKNKIFKWLQGMNNEERENIVTWAISRANKERISTRRNVIDIHQEISRRRKNKQQKKQQKYREHNEKQLRGANSTNLYSRFPELTEVQYKMLCDILEERIVGRTICHTWYDENTSDCTVWAGKIEKLKRQPLKGSPFFYRVSYWSSEEEASFDNAIDYDIPVLALAADVLSGDLSMC